MSKRTAPDRREIEIYVASLDDALRGPRRVRRSLIAEARDGLVDAAEAYQRAGLDGSAARERAVADFGAVDEIAPAYQAELSVAQGRRTGVGILLAIGVQIVAWGHTWGVLPDPPPARPGSMGDLIDTAVERVGGVCLIVALVLLLAGRLGARRPRLGGVLVRATGLLGWVVCGVLVSAATLLPVFSPAPAQTPIAAVVGPLVVFVGVPVALLVRSSRRSLALA